MKMMILNILFILLIPTRQLFAEEEASRYYDTYVHRTTVDQTVYEAIFYVPKLQKARAIVIISPTIGNYDSIEGANAHFFAKNGYVAIVPYPIPTELQQPKPDTAQLDKDYFRPITSAASFISLAESKFRLPENLPLYAMGASQGGITTVLLTSHIPRIKAAWVAVGGGDLPHIYAQSTVKEIISFRTNHMRTLGFTDQNKYEKYLKSSLKNDPAFSCTKIKVPFHQTIALRDTSVPTVSQELLAKKCPKHDIIRLNLSHGAGALTIVTMQEQIMEFFERYR